jgi:hypothetical protein
MKFSQTQKLILALVIFAIAGFIIFRSFSGSDVAGDSAAGVIDSSSQNIMDMVSKINTISINSSLFSSPLFLNLVDLTVAPTPEPQGRPNPFAPIGSDVAVQAVQKSVASSSKPTK